MLTAGDVLQFIGWVYIGVAVLAIALVLIFAKGVRNKTVSALVVLGLFSVWPVLSLRTTKHQVDDHVERLRLATERFELLCKSAGEKITRTVENVDGVLLVNVRPETKASDRGDANWPDAALPNEGRGDWYIRTFLFWEHHEDQRTPRGYLNEQPSDLPGYRFVDVKELSGSVLRYRLVKPSSADLSREHLGGKPARYAVAYTNMVDPADRQMWIAGTRVTVIDTANGEVIAEKAWFALEPGQGSTAGFRSPWGFAKTCPELKGWVGAPTRFFVDQVLKPTRGNN